MDDFFAELEKAMAVAVIPPPEPEVQPVAQPMGDFWDHMVGNVMGVHDIKIDSMPISYEAAEKALIEEYAKSSGLDITAHEKKQHPQAKKAINYGVMYGASKGKVIDLVGKPHIKLAKKGNTKKHLGPETWIGKKPK